jgi:hypothetical protein
MRTKLYDVVYFLDSTSPLMISLIEDIYFVVFAILLPCIGRGNV